MTTQQTTTKKVPHKRYHDTKKSVYNSQADVARAWAKGAFPTKNYHPEEGDTAVDLECGANFYGRQQADGSGKLYHYATLEAIRTRNGLIINNRQCWAGGFAHCSPPPSTKVDHRLPVDAIRDMIPLDRDITIYDISRVRGDASTMGGQIVEFEGVDDYAIYVGRDSTARDADAYLMELTGDEVNLDPGLDGNMTEVEKKLLMPEAVKNSDLPVVGSDEYAKTRFNDPSEETIEAEGLKHVTSSWGDHYKNHKLYRAELRDKCIVRHGEWFFIPRPDYEKKDHHNAGPSDMDRLGNHKVVRDRDTGAAVDSEGRLYVCGMVKHRRGDHDAVNLGDTWHQAVTHDRDAVTVEFGSGGSRAD